jgi:MtN3 and saliva related transmembrane protein
MKKKIYDRYMLFIGCAGSLVFYLQAYSIFIEKSAMDVSLLAFLLGLISVTSWLIYGFLLKNQVLVISNVVALIGASLTVIGILIYS